MKFWSKSNKNLSNLTNCFNEIKRTLSFFIAVVSSDYSKRAGRAIFFSPGSGLGGGLQWEVVGKSDDRDLRASQDISNQTVMRDTITI